MPFTPMHYPVGYGLSKVDRRLSFPGLIVGSVIPDVEVLVLFFFFPNLLDHLVLHSLVGVLTLGTLIAVFVTRFLYPPIISKLFGVDRKLLDDACKITPSLVLSCMLGAFFHVIVDIPMHWYNPVFWPWVNPLDIVGPLVLLFAFEGDIQLGYLRANLFLNAIMIVLWSIILIRTSGKNSWEQIWLGEPPSSLG